MNNTISCSLFSVSSLLPTYDIEVTCHFFGSKAVGDLADVVSAVFNSQFGNDEAGDAPRPAGIRRQWPTVLQPSDGWVWVSGCNAGQLYTVPHLHLARLETVQHWWCGLRRVCSDTSYRSFSTLLRFYLLFCFPVVPVYNSLKLSCHKEEGMASPALSIFIYLFFFRLTALEQLTCLTQKKSVKWQRVICSTFPWPCVATSWLCWLSGKLRSDKTSAGSGQDVAWHQI